MSSKKPFLLVILDGWGYSPIHHGNAIFQAHPPFFEHLLKTYPHTLLQAAGTAVGLPEGVPGNSSVGHMTIGCGRIIEQPLTYLNRLVTENKLLELQVLEQTFNTIVQKKQSLHLMGLLSDGNVHSNYTHLFGLIKAAVQKKIGPIFIHIFLDGRDVPARSAHVYIEKLQEFLKDYPQALIASVHGRFYAMDRDENWQRTTESYRILTQPAQPLFSDPQAVIDYYYKQQIFDEFIPPTLLNKNGIIKNNDAVVFFNIRADRARQLSNLLLNVPYKLFKRHLGEETGNEDSYNQAVTGITERPILSHFISGILYHPAFDNPALYIWPDIKDTLLDKVTEHKKTIYTIAETEKYAHVTYFFNGGKEIIRSNETRVLIPSLKVSSYAQEPQMSAQLITDHVLQALDKRKHDFYLINYANADMVGHSGDFSATEKAILCLDDQLEQLVKKVLQHNGTLLITADHGKAEEMLSPDGLINNHHTTNPVYAILVASHPTKEITQVNQLAMVMPFILEYLQLS